MTAADYPVEFGYGAQDGYYYGPNGTVGLFHRGNDRFTPAGTPIVIAGKVIGKTGATGIVSGPHLHTQAWTSTTGNTQDPTPYDFKPGVVTNTGTGSQWGNFITVDVDGVNLTYAHLSEINVSKGDVLGGDEMITKELLDMVYGAFFGSTPTDADYKNWVGKNELSNLIVQCENDQRRKDYYNTVQTGFKCLANPPGFKLVTKELYEKA